MTDDDLDEALAGRLRQSYTEMLTARTMRTPRAKEQTMDATVNRAVEGIKRLYQEGPAPRSSPFKRTRREWGLMDGEGQEGPKSELRLVD